MSLTPEQYAGLRAKALAKMPMSPVDWHDYGHVLEASEPWDPITEPENFDWFLIKEVPLRHFSEISVKEIADVEDRMERREHGDRYRFIKKLLREGGEPWPVIVASNGMVIDGYHRIAAMHDLKRETVDVLYVTV